MEISKYANHLVSECEEKESFKQCVRCRAVLEVGEEYQRHIEAVINISQAGYQGAVCVPAISSKEGIRCPLCDMNVRPGG